MASARDTATFFTEGSASQFQYVLSLYPQALRLKAERKTRKPEELIKLDNWYQNELPKKIKQRGKDAHLNHEELVQLMKWKQCRGKAYPQLNYLVKVNTPRAVMAETKKAFRKLPNLEQAITALSNLKGVGTTMASALLAAAAPETAPFMADECLMAIPEIEGIDYTTKEYLNFVQHIQSTAERLNKESNNGNTWNPHQVELALWTHFVANELDPDLLNAIPSANGKSSVSHQNGEIKAVSNNEKNENNESNESKESKENNENHSDNESSIDAAKASSDPPPPPPSADISEDTATSFGGEDSMPPSEAAPRIGEETNDSLASGTSATNDSTTNDAEATDQRQTDEESQEPPPAKKSRIDEADEK